MISKDKINEYLKDSLRCPRCGSSDINAGFVEITDDAAIKEVLCQDCDLNWTDGYTLSSVLIENGGGDDPWQECKSFPRGDWRLEVANGDTNCGYWEWVNSTREQEKNEIGGKNEP